MQLNSEERAAVVDELAEAMHECRESKYEPKDRTPWQLLDEFYRQDWREDAAKSLLPIIDRLLSERDAEIRDALLSDGAKNASAHRMQELSAQGVWHNHTLAFYGMMAALGHIGLTAEGEHDDDR